MPSALKPLQLNASMRGHQVNDDAQIRH